MKEEGQSPIRLASKQAWLAALGLVVLYLIGTLPSPQPSLPRDVETSGFPFDYAYRQLEQISKAPHPVGAKAHAQVLEHLIAEIRAMGYQPRVQEATRLYDSGFYTGLARIRNLIVEIPGREPGKTALFVAHYDSSPVSFGANDDGSGVVTLLGMLAAQKTRPQPRNDLAFLFSDGEELHLLGAEAFLEEDPLAARVAVTANFEARGKSGSAMMFESSPGNQGLVKGWAQASALPIGTSAAYEIYKNMPNDTDFTLFKKRKIAGLNFAYIEDTSRYHSLLDRFDQVDPKSLLHHGINGMALLKLFGEGDLAELGDTSGGNLVYFNLFRFFICYPQSWVIPLSLLTLSVLALLLYWGVRGGQLQIRGLIRGFLLFAAMLILGAGVASGLWQLLLKIHPAYREMVMGHPYQIGPYQLAFASLTATLLYLFLGRKGREEGGLNQLFAVCLWWSLSLIVVTVSAPGLSYLFLWPILLAVPALATLMRGEETHSPRQLIAALLLLLPAALFLLPLVAAIGTALPTALIGLQVFFLLFFLGMGLPLFWQLRGLPYAASTGFLLTLLLLIWAGYANQTGPERPSFNSLVHVTHADSGEAFWASSMPNLDEWSGGQIRDPRPRPATEVTAIGSAPWITGKAPQLDRPAPRLEVLSDSQEGRIRRLRMRASSPRGAGQLLLSFDEKLPPIKIRHQAGESILAGSLLSLFNPSPEGEELELELEAGHPLRLRLIDIDQGFPSELGVPPRPAHTTSHNSRQWFQNNTIIHANCDLGSGNLP